MAFDGTLKFDTAIDQTGFKAGLSGLGSIAKVGMTAVTGAVTAATGAVSALGAKAVSVGKEFESGMSQVQATLGLSIADVQNNIDGAADTIAALTAKAEEMGASTAFTAAQAAEGLNILAMSGYDAESSIGMIENVLSLAAAGSLSLADAATYAAGSMKGFVSEANNFENVTEASAYYADMIAKGATLAATDVSQLGEAMSQAAATADMYGQSSQATEVALLRLAEQNETGSNAATMLAATMKNLYAPTDAARGILEKLGVSAFDASGKARDFNDVVSDLDHALNLKYAGDAEAKIGAIQDIFGIQGAEGFSKLITSSAETVEKFYAGLENASGSAAQQAETMLDNLQGDITLLESAADGLYNTIYKKLNDPLRDLAQLGGGYLSTLSKAFEIGGFAGAADALGGILGQAVTQGTKYLPKLLELGTSVAESLIKGIAKNLPKILESGKEILSLLLNSITETLPILAEAGVQIVGMLGTTILDNLSLLIETAVGIIMGLVTMLSDPETLTGLLDAALSILGMLGSTITDNISLLIDAAILIIETIGVYLAEHAPELVTAAITIVTTIVSAILDHTDELLLAAENIITALWDALSDPENLQMMLDAGALMLTSIFNGLANFAGSVLGFVSDLYNALTEKIGEIEWSDIGKTILMGIVTGLENLDLGLLNGFKEAWVTGIKGIFEIQSPSKLMKREVGRYLALGIGEGFADEMPEVGQDALSAFRELRQDVDADAVLALRQNAPSLTGSSFVPAAQYSTVTNNYSYVTNGSTPAPESGGASVRDIIVPVQIGGEVVETVVVHAAQNANAVSGGDTL